MEWLLFLAALIFMGTAADVVHYMEDKEIEALANHKYGPPSETKSPSVR